MNLFHDFHDFQNIVLDRLPVAKQTIWLRDTCQEDSIACMRVLRQLEE